MWFIDSDLPLYSTEIWAEHKDPPRGEENKRAGATSFFHSLLFKTDTGPATNAQAPITGGTAPTSVPSICAASQRFDLVKIQDYPGRTRPGRC